MNAHKLFSVFSLATCVTLVSIIGCGGTGTPTAATESTESNTADGTTSGVVPVSYESGQTLTIHVPNMHCMFVCYPKVKETLQNQEGIDAESVELVEQKDEGAIDDPRIQLTVAGEGLNSQNVIEAIAAVGFTDATIAVTE